MTPHDRDEGPYTYSDAMNDWAKQPSSFIRRTQGGLLHPGASAYGFWRIVGYLWRLALVAAISLGIFHVVVRRHVKGEAFAAMIAAELQERLGAEEVVLEPFKWKGKVAISPYLRVTGGETSFFHTLEGRYFRFERSYWKLFADQWTMRTISFDSLDVHLRSGGLGEFPTGPAEGAAAGDPLAGPEAAEGAVVPDGPRIEGFDEITLDLDAGLDGDVDADVDVDLGLDDDGTMGGEEPGEATVPLEEAPLDIRINGFGVNPDLDRVKFDAIEIGNLSLSWGLSEHTKGSLAGAEAALRQEDDEWVLEVRSGTLRQNWLGGLQVAAPAAIRLGTGDTITVEPVSLSTANDGSLVLQGTVTKGDLPTLDLELAMEGVPLEDLVRPDAPILGVIDGRITGRGRLTGSINRAEGVSIGIDGTLEDGVLRRIPVLDFLALPTARGSFRRLSLTSGEFQLRTTRDVVDLPRFRFEAGEDVRIEGSLQASEGVCVGTARIGVRSSLLDGFPGLRDAHFTMAPSGREPVAWLDAPIDGPLATITRELADRLFATYQEEEAARR